MNNPLYTAIDDLSQESRTLRIELNLAKAEVVRLTEEHAKVRIALISAQAAANAALAASQAAVKAALIASHLAQQFELKEMQDKAFTIAEDALKKAQTALLASQVADANVKAARF